MKVKAREVLSNMKAYPLNKSIDELQKELGFQKAYKLAENENIFGCSPHVKNKLPEFLGELFAYPDGHARNLTQCLSSYLQVPYESLFLGNGSDEIIHLLTRAFISLGDEAIMADITFPRYKTNVLIEGGIPVTIPLVDGVHDLQQMLNAITENTKMIFVCNPNNPTGTIVKKETLLQFLNSVPEHILIVLDEAYYEYSVSEEFLQSIPLLENHQNLVILRTFSKAYGLAALRVGYGIMNPAYVETLTKVKDVFNVNQIAQTAAILALEDQTFIADCIDKNEKGKHFLERELISIGYDYFPSQANFIMIKTKQRGDIAANALMKHGIIVRAGTLLGVPHSIRVTISSSEDNQYFIETFKQLAEKGEV